MNRNDDTALAERLRTSVNGLDLIGPGPDLGQIRQRGAARRRRRTASMAAGTALLISAVALAVPLVQDGGYSARDSFAGPGRTSDTLQPTRSPEPAAGVALRAFRRALDDAGIAYPIKGLEAGQPGTWSLGWRSTEPEGVLNFQVAVYPADQYDEGINPCAASSPRTRNCARETLANGIELHTAEELVDQASAPGYAPTWRIRALAVHPGGAFVTADASLFTRADETSPDNVPVPYTGPVSEAQLVQLVSDSRLAATA